MRVARYRLFVGITQSRWNGNWGRGMVRNRRIRYGLVWVVRYGTERRVRLDCAVRMGKRQGRRRRRCETAVRQTVRVYLVRTVRTETETGDVSKSLSNSPGAGGREGRRHDGDSITQSFFFRFSLPLCPCSGLSRCPLVSSRHAQTPAQAQGRHQKTKSQLCSAAHSARLFPLVRPPGDGDGAEQA